MAFLHALAVLSVPLGAASSACFDGQGGFTQEHWSFCERLTEKILMYYGPSGDFLKLGLFVDSHSGWSALAFGGNGGMKGAQQFVVRKVNNAFVAEERYSTDYVTPELQPAQEIALIFASEDAATETSDLKPRRRHTELGFVVRKVNNAFVAEERYSTDYVTPELQPAQEIALIFASEENGNIAWGVAIPRSSCAAGERYPVEDISRFMHWALGDSHDFYHHTSRGQFHANLISGPTTMEDFSNAQNISFTMPDVSVVMGAGGNDEKNPYLCTLFDLSQMLPSSMNLADKHHVAMFSPILDTDSAAYVHHMILYACEDEDAASGFQHGQVVPECESMPRGCNALKWPWAVGSESVVFPPQAGMPMGQGQKWFALQMHYYNPSLTTGIKDSSGVRVTFATQLRTYDAGTFRFNGGTGDDQRDPIPAGESEYTLPKAYVPSTCTNKWTVDEVTVLGVVYHAHLVGKNLNIDVVRGGEHVGQLRREKRYDFSHQSLEPSSVGKLKGDELIFSCTYDTSSRTSPTTFGDFTQTEMCWSAFMYYPAQRMNRAIYFGSNMMYCEGADLSPQFFFEPVVPASTCVQSGDLRSTAGQQALTAMGVDVSSIQPLPEVTSTSVGQDSSISNNVQPGSLAVALTFALAVQIVA